MAKRSATSDLNHTNWDNEEEPEEAGVFQKASSEVLETRIIKTAKRRAKMGANNSDSKPSPFSGFTGFGNATSTTSTTSPFSFLSQQNKPKPTTTESSSDKNGTDSSKEPQFKSFTNSPFSSASQQQQQQQKDASGAEKSSTDAPTFKPFEHIFKTSWTEKDKKKENLEILKDLNLSCSSWIAEHLDKNPYCILTPIFKDYEKHLAQIDLSGHVDSSNDKSETTTSHSKTETPKQQFSFNKEESTEEEKKEKTSEFKFESKPMQQQQQQQPPMKPLNFQFGSANTTPFGGASNSPFSLNQIAAKPPSESESKKDDEESEEPPKNEFTPVVEEDSIFDVKCKVFVKKEGNFVSRGVGTLFLKPVKDSTKTQVVVRAHTNLGNILLNILLTPGMPIQKTGKNNAMIVCVPTPDSQPPPVPVLIRVKTTEECDTLIKKLEECRGS